MTDFLETILFLLLFPFLLIIAFMCAIFKIEIKEPNWEGK